LSSAAACNAARRAAERRRHERQLRALRRAEASEAGELLLPAEFEKALGRLARYDRWLAATAPQLAGLRQCQLDALAFADGRAEEASEDALGELCERVEGIGKSRAELANVLDHIRESAPVIIHIDVPKVLELLVEDSHYRSLFETKTSNGHTDRYARKSWEHALFGEAYDKATPFERCKYGVPNLSGSYYGVSAADSYGDSYLLLKKKVRRRITITDMDSSDCDGGLPPGTPAHFAHVLATFSDDELASVFDAGGRGRNRQTAAHSDDATEDDYKEVQVHGALSLSRDVEALVLNSMHKDDAAVQALARRFADKFGVSFVQLEDEDFEDVDGGDSEDDDSGDKGAGDGEEGGAAGGSADA
jgi:hypothetical protein